jgi:hypothetical protein
MCCAVSGGGRCWGAENDVARQARSLRRSSLQSSIRVMSGYGMPGLGRDWLVVQRGDERAMCLGSEYVVPYSFGARLTSASVILPSGKGNGGMCEVVEK